MTQIPKYLSDRVTLATAIAAQFRETGASADAALAAATDLITTEMRREVTSDIDMLPVAEAIRDAAETVARKR